MKCNLSMGFSPEEMPFGIFQQASGKLIPHFRATRPENALAFTELLEFRHRRALLSRSLLGFHLLA